jgi:SprT protein
VTLPDRAELERRTAELFAQWRVAGQPVAVRWNVRLQTSAGRAFVRAGSIELNPNLLGPHPERVDAVLVHEAAHVAAFRLFGPVAKAHGRHWRALVRLAGQVPSVVHDLPVRPARRRGYVYLRVCAGCGHRTLLRAPRYGRCPGCARREGYLVLRAPATAAGRAALARLSLAEVRARCAGAAADSGPGEPRRPLARCPRPPAPA